LRVLIERDIRVESARAAETLKTAVEEDLGLAPFVAVDVLLTPGGEFGQFFPVRHGGVSTPSGDRRQFRTKCGSVLTG
jgi:hypothetical protein